MTTELEKQFFETFWIEKRCLIELEVGWCGHDCSLCGAKKYPPITDRHYLELICLMSEEAICFTNYSTNVEHLKEYILKELILDKDFFDKYKVQELLKGE